MSKIGDRIRSRRKEIGMSVDELSVLIGKDRSTIYRYESDDIEKLPVPILIPLAEALKTSPGYILGWTDNPAIGKEILDGETILCVDYKDFRLKNDTEKEIVEKYRELSDERKNKVEEFIDDQIQLEMFGENK